MVRHAPPESNLGILLEMPSTGQLLQAYIDAFNAGDEEALLATLADDVIHEINEGETELGKDRYRAFRAHMNACYAEQLEDAVLFENGSRGAVEAMCAGRYIQTDAGLPLATGQTYRVRIAIFAEGNGHQLTRVTSFYNLRKWIEAVS